MSIFVTGLGHLNPDMLGQAAGGRAVCAWCAGRTCRVALWWTGSLRFCLGKTLRRCQYSKLIFYLSDFFFYFNDGK